ncbi:hypothetical protein BT69DRAFT_1293049 [Atractiella rhizophila]|nr:hypothetical protein BT69DRAFT_1293049 [Atractiella rhizophila]
MAKTPAPVPPLDAAISFQSFRNGDVSAVPDVHLQSVGRRMEGGLQASYAGVIVDVETEINVEKSSKGHSPSISKAFGAFDNEDLRSLFKDCGVIFFSTGNFLSYLLERNLILELLGTATRITSEPLRSTSDFSYDSDQKARPNYRVVEAACFIDLLFSSGVHMVSTAFARCLIVVLGVYVQIKHQDVRVTAAESYQPAIDMIKPVIQGKVDNRTGDEFKPSTRAHTRRLNGRLTKRLFKARPIPLSRFRMKGHHRGIQGADDVSKVPCYAQNPSYAAVPSSDYKVATEAACERYKVASEVSKAPSCAKDPSYALLRSSDYKLATEAATDGYKAANAASEG